jgi:sortase A
MGSSSVKLTVLRLVRGVGWVFIWLGVYLLGFVAYQLWFTDLLTARAQQGLQTELAERFDSVTVETIPYVPAVTTTTTIPPDGGPATSTTVPARDYLLVEEVPAEGDSFARIVIPAIDVDVAAVEGVDRNDLKKGPGHMDGTAMPGQPGNSVFSGHRTTYGAPFHNLDRLGVGDIIEVETAIGTHVYELREVPFIVKPTDVWVTAPREGAWLTLTTCNPKFSARERLIVQAELVAGPNAAVILPS